MHTVEIQDNKVWVYEDSIPSLMAGARYYKSSEEITTFISKLQAARDKAWPLT